MGQLEHKRVASKAGGHLARTSRAGLPCPWASSSSHVPGDSAPAQARSAMTASAKGPSLSSPPPFLPGCQALQLISPANEFDLKGNCPALPYPALPCPPVHCPNRTPCPCQGHPQPPQPGFKAAANLISLLALRCLAPDTPSVLMPSRPCTRYSLGGNLPPILDHNTGSFMNFPLA